MGNELRFRNKITVMSFACSLLVIWIHTNNVVSYGLSDTSTGGALFVFCIEEYWGTVANMIAVPAFFMISGYLFFRTYQTQKVLYKYKSRLFSIVLPYLLWCTIYYLFFALVTNVPYIRNYISADRYEVSLSAYMSSLWMDQYYTLWFLKDLIVFIIFSPLLYYILKDYKSAKVGLAVLIIAIINQQIGAIKIPFSGLVYYILGAYLAINYKKIVEKESGKFSKVLSVITIVGGMLTKFKWGRPVIVIAFIIAVWILLDCLSIEWKLPWWMQITFFVYVSHDMILEFYEKILLILCGKTVVIALMDYIFMPVVVYVTIAVIAKIIMKNSVLWRILAGNRTVEGC